MVMYLLPRHIDADAILEALHGGAHGRLELDDVDAVVERLGIHDHLHVHRAVLQDALDGCK